MNVHLIGYRGVGKTTVAPLIAAKLQLRWMDLDDKIERRTGHSIAAIFKASGEQAFRVVESAELLTVASLDGFVVATGGGIVLCEENRVLLRHGRCMWLRARLETIVARLATDDERPPLTNLDLEAETKAKLAIRTPIYESLADFVVDVDDLTPQAVAERVARLLTQSLPTTS